MEGAYSPDLNTHDVPRNPSDWKQAARLGSNKHCTHRELEVLGVAFTYRKVEDLRSGIAWQLVNREGFMVVWRNPGGWSTNLRPNSVLRRLNDLYQWSKHGIQVTIPVETAWDRFELTTGKLMVGAGSGSSSAQAKKELEEKENQRFQAEKDKEIEELKKQAKEKEDEQLAAKKEIEELKKQAREKEEVRMFGKRQEIL
ncbi:unnamed protein product [Linum tenue]|uniref:Uncharacterized protein n=1 Tax=Linum tenue TaxID=586396 RepID=A0AAV0RRP8_9ROSI|nr:unnamed protein product [Linum tenue]